MRDLYKVYLKSRSIDEAKLIKFGFTKNKDKCIYSKEIKDGEFKVVIEVDKKKAISKVIDCFDDSEYALVDVEESSGQFVGSIKEEYEKVLEKFVNKCTYLDTFKSSSAKKIISYVKEKYDGELEFLWDDYDGAVFRNQDNKKWYGVIM